MRVSCCRGLCSSLHLFGGVETGPEKKPNWLGLLGCPAEENLVSHAPWPVAGSFSVLPDVPRGDEAMTNENAGVSTRSERIGSATGEATATSPPGR